MAVYHQVATILAQEFKDKFGDLSVDQIWAIVKLVKLVRRSCRSNVALNPCLGLVFPGFSFSQYETGKHNTRTGKPIQGLKITPPVGQPVTQTEGDEDDE